MSNSSVPVDPAASEPPDDLLSEPQRRHLEVVLGMLERLLDLIDGLAPSLWHRTASVLTVDVLDLPTETFAKLAPFRDTARAHVQYLTTRLGLRPQHRSIRQRLHTLLIGEMVRVETRADRMLRGFGPLHPDVPAVLDPSLGAIREALTAMQRLVDAAPPMVRGPEASRP